MRDSKRILIITYKYLPEIAPRVFRWSSLVDYWVKQGHCIDVICASFPGQPNYESIDSSKIYRVTPWFKKTNEKSTNKNNSPLENISENNQDLSLLDNDHLEISIKAIEINPSIIRKIICKFLFILQKIIQKVKRTLRAVKRSGQKILNNFKRLQRNYLWPDYGMYWIVPAIKKAVYLIKNNSYDAIITVSWPVSPHVVGWFIKKYLIKKNINWIVDIGDPFSFNTITPINNFKIFSKLNSSFERSMLRKADSISVTTARTKEEYVKFTPGVKEKIFVISPMIPQNNHNNFNLDNYSKSKMKIVFTGSLRLKNRRPDMFLKLFAESLSNKEINEKFELHFYGDVKQCLSSFEPYKRLLNKKIFIHGIVSKCVVDEVIRSSDFLLNIGNLTEYQLPSKVVEYLSANKPIINITTNINDSSWEVLSISPLATNFFIKDEQIDKDLVSKLINFLINPPSLLSDDLLKQITLQYQIEMISESYFELFD